MMVQVQNYKRASITASKVLFFALIICFPTLLNGKPFTFFDTAQYYDVGSAIFTNLGLADPATTLAAAENAASQAPSSDRTVSDTSAIPTEGGLAAIAGGRSPIYSILIYVMTVVFSVTGVVIIQALILGGLIHLVFDRHIPDVHYGLKSLLVASITLLTPLGFHAGFLMPDIFGGIFVLSALLLVSAKTYKPFESWTLLLLMSGSAMMHSTIPPLGVAIIALIFVAKVLGYKGLGSNRFALFGIVGSIVIALVTSTAYKAAVEHVTGDEIRSAPYFMARVIADGSGQKYLEQNCQDSDFQVCAFRDVDYFNHDDFLWGGYGEKENFSTADPAVRKALQDEERAFVVEAISAYPLIQIQASFKNAVVQFFSTNINELYVGAEAVSQDGFATSPFWSQFPISEACRSDASACDMRTPVRQFWSALVHTGSLLCLALLIAAIAVLHYRSFKKNEPIDPHLKPLVDVAILTIVVLVANAAMCGMISGPLDRYQARLAWLPALFLGVGTLLLYAPSRAERS